MAHSHYVIDLYFADSARPERPRHDVLRIDAHDDEAAVAEGKRIDGWRKPESFRVRSIRTTARSGDKVIYQSSPGASDDVAAASELPDQQEAGTTP